MFSSPDGRVSRLRRVAPAHRKGGKGEIESRGSREEFQAISDGVVRARAASLRELARELRRLGLDPREVVVESSKPIQSIARTGLRG
jgi:hypothetical protein